MSQTTTMHAWQTSTSSKEATLVTIPIPEVQSDEILVRILASGLCHSDLTILNMETKLPGWNNPFVLGHEGSGEIVKVGFEVGSQYYIGQRVAVLCTPGCNESTCINCGRGRQSLCHAGANPGLGSNGLFAEYISVKPWGIVPIPENVATEVAAVAGDAVLTAYHAIKTIGQVQPDQTIAIFGLGGVGFNGLQIALHSKVKRILVVDTRQEVLDQAVKLGIAPEDALLVGSGPQLQDKVTQDGIVLDTVIDFVGNAATFMSAQLALRPGGSIILIGLGAEQLPLISLATVMKEISIKTGYNGTREEFLECLDLISKGFITPRVDTGHIRDLPQALKDLDAGKIKSRLVLTQDW